MHSFLSKRYFLTCNLKNIRWLIQFANRNIDLKHVLYNYKMIKLIYGSNGTGKTQFSEQEFSNNNKNTIVINSQMKNWYFQEEKIISEWKFKNKSIDDEIKRIEKTIFGKEFSVLKEHKIPVGEMKELFKRHDFDKVSKWVDFYNQNNEHISENMIPRNVGGYVNEEVHKKFANFFGKSNDEKIADMKGMLTLFKQFELIEVKNNYNSPNAEIIINQFNKLKEIVGDYVRNNTPSEIISLSLDEIKFCFEADNAGLAEFNILALKQSVIYSSEFHKILKLLAEKNSLKNECIKFSDFITNSKIMDVGASFEDDGYSIKFEREFSSGEFAVVLLKIFNSYKVKRNIIYDDIFETLDLKNIMESVNLIAQNALDFKNNDLMILTHNVQTLNMVGNILNDNGVEFGKFDVVEDTSGNIKKYLLKNTSSKIKTYEDFFSSILAEEKGKKLIFSKTSFKTDLIYTIKLFGRYHNKNGMLSDMSHSKLSSMWGVQIFNATSNYMQHYEEKIDIEKFKKIFNFSFLNSSEKRYMNSIEICDQLINLFKNELIKSKNSSLWGIDFNKVIIFIEKLKMFLVVEKDLINKHLQINQSVIWKTKNERLKSLWPDGTIITTFDNQTITRKDRNNLIHALDYDLSEIAK